MMCVQNACGAQARGGSGADQLMRQSLVEKRTDQTFYLWAMNNSAEWWTMLTSPGRTAHNRVGEQA
jgi:hypothetical protein